MMAGSGSVGMGGWLTLSKRINKIFNEDPEVAGVVVTHGTYTMEETAYWLNLTVKSDKPVVITGTMRPPSAMGTDADNNLLDACILAASSEGRGKGVLLVLNNEIQAAREVTKQNSYRLETFGSRELGMLGYLDSDLRPMFYRMSTRKNTYQTEFDVSNLETLPQVDIAYAYEGASGVVVRALTDAGVAGIVAVASGGGPEMTTALVEARQKGVVVVAANRTGAGRVIRTSRQRQDGIVAGDNLSLQKARILLMLALTITKDVERIQTMFDTY
jgi:L-asparaginase type II